jgi:accessory colonization factor AcfC
VSATMPLQEVKIDNDRVLQDIADLLVKSHKIVLITGAGISTSCGIPVCYSVINSRPYKD